MNAINFSTLLPLSLIRRTRLTAYAPAAKTATEVQPHTAITIPVDLRAKALRVGQDLERRDLATLLKLVSWIFQPVAARKNITLRLEAPEIGLMATCQEVRIQRVLENLLTNALRHAPANSQVTLASRVEDGWLCIWVDDEGTGVPLAKQAELFEGQEFSFGEFALGVSEDKHGLVVCKEIVSAHGGEILMYNRVGGGAHFEFRLPSTNRGRNHTDTGSFTAATRSGASKLPLFAQVA